MKKNNVKRTIDFKRAMDEIKFKNVRSIKTALNQYLNEGYCPVAFARNSEVELCFYLIHRETGEKLCVVKVLD